jgi:hypothetical protein
MEIKPQAMAIPKETNHLEQGKYGPIYPKSPASHGFRIIAKAILGREPIFYQHAQNIEEAVAGQPDCLAPLKLHYLRWVTFHAARPDDDDLGNRHALVAEQNLFYVGRREGELREPIKVMT